MMEQKRMEEMQARANLAKRSLVEVRRNALLWDLCDQDIPDLLAEVERLRDALGAKEAINQGYAATVDHMGLQQQDFYRQGADYAFYELCKELDVYSQDIRHSNDTIDGKAARLAGRITEELRGPQNEQEGSSF